MLRFDVAPADLNTILEKLKLERVDAKSMLNPKDFFQYPYYLPLDGKYQIYQGKDQWGEVLTIKQRSPFPRHLSEGEFELL